MSTGAAPFSTPQPAPLSQVGRVVNTFFAPSKTFADIRRSASWWLPWVLIGVFSMAFMLTIDKKIGWEQIVRVEISRSPSAQARMERATPEQREQGIRLQTTISRYSGYLSPVLTLLYFLIVAGVLLAVFNFGAGAEIKFGAAMAIVAYASLPGCISALLGIASVQAGVNPEGFSIRNPVATNLAYFLNPAGNKFLYGMASAVDIFVIWTLILLGIGFAANSKLKRGTSIAIVVVVYLVYKLAASGVGALIA